jgi:5-methylcytosine-specific restriction protein A
MIDFLYSFFHPRTFGAVRSSKWPAVMKAYRAEHPNCAVCGSKGNLLNPLNCHHKTPFHTHPELELESSNLIMLCRVHHLWVGHLGNFKSWNETVEQDSKYWLDKITNRPS